MRNLYTLVIVFLMGCSIESDVNNVTRTNVDSNEQYVPAYDKERHNPCGRTYKVVVPYPDGSKAFEHIPVYCPIWDGNFDIEDEKSFKYDFSDKNIQR